jgi:hypothetical protein
MYVLPPSQLHSWVLTCINSWVRQTGGRETRRSFGPWSRDLESAKDQDFARQGYITAWENSSIDCGLCPPRKDPRDQMLSEPPKSQYKDKCEKGTDIRPENEVARGLDECQQRISRCTLRYLLARK